MSDLAPLLQELTGSPWLWTAVFLTIILEGLLPFMPSETAVVLIGVNIAPHTPSLGLLILVTATGAFAGDALSYLLGCKAGPRVVARLQRGERGRHAQEWAQRQLERHGRLLILFARYIPGGRLATMSSAGALGFPPRWFLPIEMLASLVWGTQASLFGFLGGSMFRGQPLTGMAVSYGVMVAVLIGTRITQRQVRRRYRTPKSSALDI